MAVRNEEEQERQDKMRAVRNDEGAHAKKERNDGSEN